MPVANSNARLVNCACKYCGARFTYHRKKSKCKGCADKRPRRYPKPSGPSHYCRMTAEQRAEAHRRSYESRKARKRADPSFHARLNAQKRARRERIAAAEGRVLGQHSLSFEQLQDRVVERNARQAWRYWLRQLASDAWLDAYYAASTRPWRDHRLNANQARVVRYGADSYFRDRQRMRLAVKKRERRAQIASAGGLNYLETYALLIEAVSCHYCRCALDASNRTLDHVVPLSRGGGHDRSNLVHACRSCNSSKQDKSHPAALRRHQSIGAL